jgi:VanZ family protein
MAEHTTPWIRRGVVLLTIAFWIVLIVATHAPRVPEAVSIEPTDKIAHLAGYGLLGLLVGRSWALYYGYGRLAAVGLFVAIAAHAALDEVTQPMFGRYADITDWYADMVGAALGLAAASLIWHFRLNRKSARGS